MVRPNGHPTLAEAVALADGKADSRIVLTAGTYRLTEPIRLGPGHAGLMIEAAPGARPILIGGPEISGWKREGVNFVAPVSEAIAQRGSRLLIVGDQLRPRSRWPETGELNHESVFDVTWMSTTGGGWQRKPTPEELTRMRFKAGDLGPWLDPQSAEVTVYHMWDESALGVSERDDATRTLRFSSPSGHPPGAFGVTKYVVWNTARGVTRPGQWFLDRRNRRVVYRPRPGEKPETFRATLGQLTSLILLQNAPRVTIRSLTLRGTDVELKAGGFGAYDYTGAVTASGAPSLRLENLTVEAVAGWGVGIIGSPDSHVVGCTIRNVGAGGIRLEGDRSVIADNVVQGVGRQYPSAIGLWTAGKDARVEHNRVTETSYTAILGAGTGTVIEANRIARAMEVLHDGAGIYVGFTSNVTIRGNLATDIVDTGGYGASAYYLDENAVGCTLEGNVSIGIDRPSQNHMARNNVIRRNLFVGLNELRLDFARCEGYRLENNVFLGAKGLALRASEIAIAAMEGNAWDPGSGAVNRTFLNQYAETSTARQAGITPQALRLNRRGDAMFSVSSVDGKGPAIAPWDMRRVGPRPKAD